VATRRIVLAALAGLMAIQVLRPGDIPFLNDEPNLIGSALVANQGGRLAEKGLVGSFGLAYAPVCVWIYQALLLVTRDIVSLAAIKIALVWLAVWIAVARLAVRTGLSPWPLLLIPLSPYLAFFQRLLWDNVFLIPVSIGMVAVLAGFLVRPSVRAFTVWAALAVLAFHVHVLGAVPIAACALTLFVFRRDWLLEQRGKVAVVLVAALLVSARFLYAIVAERGEAGHAHPAFAHSLEGTTEAFLLWSHAGFEFFVPAFYRDLPGGHFLQVIPGWLAFLAGVAALAGFLVESARRRLPLRDWPLDRQLAFLAVAMLLLQVALLLVLRLEPLWHYFNGVWFATFYVLWWGFDRVRLHLWARALLLLQIATVGALTFLLAQHVHAHHGDRNQAYGATLANQLDVARAVVARRPKSIERRVANYAQFPHALQVLVLLEADRTHTQLDVTPERAVVQYTGTSPDDGAIGIEFER
jgi:hypothetical protein